MKQSIVVVLDNIRSTYNVGSILRSCDSLGAGSLYCCGITPYPLLAQDSRLPHIANRAHRQIAKTSLGAEKTVATRYYDQAYLALDSLEKEGFLLCAIEQDQRSSPLVDVSSEKTTKIALIIGSEVDGVSDDLLSRCDRIYEIAQQGSKNSLNASVATALALYQLSLKA